MQDASAGVSSAVTIGDLLETHPEYCESDWDRNERLYAGGLRFRSALDEFLPPRPIERYAQSGIASRHRSERLAAACYIPRGSGLIDWLIAATFRGEPGLICDGTRADNTYWESLVPDADGAGRSMAQLCRDALLAIMLYGRAAFYVRFPAEIGIPSRPETLAARLAVLPAPAIEDWELDERGDYAWVRLHTIETIRSAPEKQPRMELHRWTYLWPDRQVVYSASKEVRAAWKRDTVLTPIVIQHDFGRLPVFPVRAPASAYVMGRIADVLGALFARETSLSFALNSAAYPLLVLRLAASDPKQIVASELAALRLQVGEEAQYLSPPSDAFAALFRDVERLRLALYEALHSLALSAPAQTQNPRQSAAAKALDRDPLETLLDSFAWPVRDALARALTAIAEYRREDPGGIRLIGFERPERIAMENLRQIVLGDGIPVAIGPGMEEGEAEGEADEHEQ